MGTGGREHGLLIRAVLSGVVGVLFGMLSYFLVIHFIWGGALPCHAVFLGNIKADAAKGHGGADTGENCADDCPPAENRLQCASNPGFGPEKDCPGRDPWHVGNPEGYLP